MSRADFYIETSEYDKAVIDLEEAKSLAIEQNELYNICGIGTKIASLYYEQNEFVKALFYIDGAIHFEKNRLVDGGLLGSITHAHILRNMIFHKLE